MPNLPNPRRVAAGRRNRLLRGPLTEPGRRSLQAAILETKPWTRSTGPKTDSGKQRSSANGRRKQKSPLSSWTILEDIREAAIVISGLSQLHQLMSESSERRSKAL